MSHSTAFVLHTRRKRLERNRTPQALNIFRDDAIVKGTRFDPEPGIRGRAETFVGQTETEDSLEIVFESVVFVAFRRQRPRQGQPVGYRQFTAATVVRLEQGEDVEGCVRRGQICRPPVRREKVGDRRLHLNLISTTIFIVLKKLDRFILSKRSCFLGTVTMRC